MVITLEFDLFLADGELADSTDGDEPLMIIQGRGHIVPGLEEALYGMRVGDEKEVTLAPDNGFGEYDEEALQWLPMDAFTEEMEIEVGLEVEVLDEESDDVIVAYIADIEQDRIQLDFNHPLAGETLLFRVRVVGIRPATVEELEHDHAHDMSNGHYS